MLYFAMAFGLIFEVSSVIVGWGSGIVIGVIVFSVGFFFHTDPRRAAERRARRRGGMLL